MAYYELTYILRPDLNPQQVEQVNSRVAALIEADKGAILRTEQWGRRDLAYPVKKSGKGFYVFHVVEGGGDMAANTSTRLNIDEDVLKHMWVNVDKPTLSPTPMISPDRPERGEGRPFRGPVGEVGEIGEGGEIGDGDLEEGLE
ncbi:MAG: 30S ribosomal protein S6 [Magnetococcales bacterium]|nr:30S ribosomal protein S6 [Magnetococcales bacterium]